MSHGGMLGSPRRQCKSSKILYYLDDFWCGDEKDKCLQTFITFKHVCNQLNIPLSPGKLEGPTPIITFLGIELNAPHQSLSLPPEKLQQLQQELSEWDPNGKKCTKRDLLSLIGKLSFASKCIPAGRIFFRRLIDLSMKAQKLHHRLDLTIEARQDIAWWARFLPEWNGTARFIEPTWTPADSLQLFTYAAASVGCLLHG
ncbi:uncharacterized protein [Amphiura filiformis]|uniref:uncharacterized protein n=1 Tax=Amphiura filiformis TaxID=82378 RepID=UPI003B2230C7